MPRKKKIDQQEEAAAVRPPRKRARTSPITKNPPAASLLPPIVTVTEIAPPPVTRTWMSILHDGRVYKTTTTVLSRALLISSAAVYIIAFALATFSVFADVEVKSFPSGPGKGQLINAATAAGFTNTEKGETANIGQFVAQFLIFFFGALGLMFLCYIVYAGFLWLSAAGEDDKIKKARGIIFHSVFGLIISVVSFAVAEAWMSNLAKLVTK